MTEQRSALFVIKLSGEHPVRTTRPTTVIKDTNINVVFILILSVIIAIITFELGYYCKPFSNEPVLVPVLDTFAPVFVPVVELPVVVSVPPVVVGVRTDRSHWMNIQGLM
jgi:hypothetical protein